MQITGNHWAWFAPDGVSVQKFDARAEGNTIVLMSADGTVLVRLPGPSLSHRWVEAGPVAAGGQSLVLRAHYLGPFGCSCSLHVVGADRGKRDVAKDGNAYAVARAIVMGAPVLGCAAMLRSLGSTISFATLPASVLAGIVFYGAAISAGKVGLVGLAAAKTRGRHVGLLSMLIAAAVMASCGAVMVAVLAGPFRSYLTAGQ